jgi:hypothetical protein
MAVITQQLSATMRLVENARRIACQFRKPLHGEAGRQDGVRPCLPKGAHEQQQHRQTQIDEEEGGDRAHDPEQYAGARTLRRLPRLICIGRRGAVPGWHS